MVRAILIRPDGSEGLGAFFRSVEEAREWVEHYLSHPAFAGYSSVIEVTE